MTNRLKKDYINVLRERYNKAKKKEKTQLLEMSASTIERFLKGHKARLRRYANGGTVSTQSYMKRKIPIRDINYNIAEPGHFEADTVAHCGNSLVGSFVWSVTMTDIYSGWTENRAIWNNGSHGVMEAVKSIEH